MTKKSRSPDPYAQRQLYAYNKSIEEKKSLEAHLSSNGKLIYQEGANYLYHLRNSTLHYQALAVNDHGQNLFNLILEFVGTDITSVHRDTDHLQQTFDYLRVGQPNQSDNY